MKAIKILSVIAALLIAGGLQAFAQPRTISGSVTDGQGEPLAGATVVATGTRAYAVTDADGKFSLKAAVGETVTVSFLGYDD